MSKFIRGFVVVFVLILFPLIVSAGVAFALSNVYNAGLVMMPVLLFFVYCIGQVADYSEHLRQRAMSVNDKVMTAMREIYESSESIDKDRILFILLYIKKNLSDEVSVEELEDQIKKFQMEMRDGKD